MTAMSNIPTLETLSTPVIWTDAAGHIAGTNSAFSRWLGIGARRVFGQPLIALEQEGDALARALAQSEHDTLHLRRITLGIPGEASHLADGRATRMESGWLLEIHPVDTFPVADPAAAIPDAFAAALKGLAHELRNPLAGLKGAAQLLARRANQHQDQNEQELIELIGSEIERLNTLLDRLMSPTPPRPHAPLNIHAVLERVLRLAETDSRWTTSIQRDYDPSIPEFTGDADRLTQAIWNLVRNAAEAGASIIVLRTRVESGPHTREHAHVQTVKLEIIDDGHGVPEALTEHLFLPLVSGRAEGSGLGLALAHQVAREHHGSLTLRSRPGHTIFVMTLASMPNLPDTEENENAH
jgi:two-component system nitrogen regulation sensor histidine kinase GlnL